MPAYTWSCLACDRTNPALASFCERCGCPAQASGSRIEGTRSAWRLKAKLPLAAEWAEITKTSPFFTVQDQAFPKQQADQYFSVQSDLLQGSVTPAEAAKKMQDIVSAWVKK